MRKILRKATITQILSETDISSIERDYETEETILRNCHKELSTYYHGMYENSNELETFFSVKIRDLTQKYEDFTIAEDPFTGAPVLFRRIQKKRFDLLLSFPYKSRTKSYSFSIDVAAQHAVRIREGMKVWTVIIKKEDEFNIERIRL